MSVRRILIIPVIFFLGIMCVLAETRPIAYYFPGGYGGGYYPYGGYRYYPRTYTPYGSYRFYPRVYYPYGRYGYYPRYYAPYGGYRSNPRVYYPYGGY